jgi:hypothetical protein
MRKVLQLFIMFMWFVLSLLGRPYIAQPVGSNQDHVRAIMESHHAPTANALLLVAENRFIDNGNGTVTDTKSGLMWQQSDNGKAVAFQEAQDYCRSLRLGGHTDWRLPEPAEVDTAVAVELMMSRHSRDLYSRFDLYWSSDRTALLPFNYHPSRGKTVERVYPARGDDRAYVRAVRFAKNTRPGGAS